MTDKPLVSFEESIDEIMVWFNGLTDYDVDAKMWWDEKERIMTITFAPGNGVCKEPWNCLG